MHIIYAKSEVDFSGFQLIQKKVNKTAPPLELVLEIIVERNFSQT